MLNVCEKKIRLIPQHNYLSGCLARWMISDMVFLVKSVSQHLHTPTRHLASSEQ